VKSFSSLSTYKEKTNEDKELRAFEGIRVISMWYGLFCMMALYILVPAIANIQFMIELFKNPAFTLASSGNMSGTAFLFSSAFLVFI